MYWLYGVVAAVVAYATYWAIPPNRNTKYSFEVSGPKEQGATRPRRNAISKELIAQPAGCATLYESFLRASREYAKNDCFGHRETTKVVNKEVEIAGVMKPWTYYERSKYQWRNFQDSFQLCLDFGSGLRELGIEPKERLAIYEETSLEWTVAEQACYSQNITVLTVYANLGIEALTFALEQAQVKFILTNASLFPQLVGILDKCHALKCVIYIGEATNKEATDKLTKAGIKLVKFYDVLELGKEHAHEATPPTPDDLACIMYTSGSTGIPKGVMISHANMISAVGGFGSCFSVIDGDTYLNYLPLAHVLAMVVENAVIHYGARMGFGNPKSLTEDNMVPGCLGDLRELQPTAFAGVPLVYDRIKAGIMKKVAAESFLKRTIFNYAMIIKQIAWKRGKSTPILNLLVFNQLKSRLGGKMRFMVSGGAPISASAHLFLEACFGIPVLQGYGLTETCGAGTVMMLSDASQGTVGPPVPCVEIKLVDCPANGYLTSNSPPQGEVWMRGPCITKGYYHNDAATKEQYTEDGWFKTGDVGRWNPNGTLSIVDRIKNLVKVPTGEYIALEKIESIYKNSKFVVNACVFASGEESVVIAIVQPQPIPIEIAQKANGTVGTLPSKDATLPKLILADMNATGRRDGLKSFEAITHVIVVDEEWSPDNNMLTAAMKLNRRIIYQTYQNRMNEILRK